jgi:hypothetical protein
MNKKHGFLAAAAVLFVAAGFALSFMACSESKPSKPSVLETTATYQQALDKVNEVINYCNNSTDYNKQAVTSLEGMKSELETADVKDNWSSKGPGFISRLNIGIGFLD